MTSRLAVQFSQAWIYGLDGRPKLQLEIPRFAPTRDNDAPTTFDSCLGLALYLFADIHGYNNLNYAVYTWWFCFHVCRLITSLTPIPAIRLPFCCVHRGAIELYPCCALPTFQPCVEALDGDERLVHGSACLIKIRRPVTCRATECLYSPSQSTS
jgi:hypothetical protein